MDNDAKAQPTAWGQTIQSLAVWNGNLYAGYGDSNANTGPINVTPYHLPAGTSSGQWFPTQLTDLTEEIDNFRLITANGSTNLYAPSVDPRGFTSTDYAYGTIANNTETWTQVQMYPGGAFQHAFDMTTLTGSDLWEVGSYVPPVYPGTTTTNTKAAAYATAFRGEWVNGVLEWQQQADATVGPDLASCTICDVRYYGAGVFNGKLYLQPQDAETGLAPYAEVFDGATWSQLRPSPFTVPIGYPRQFDGKMVFLSASGYVLTSALYAFDGTSTSTVGPTSFYGYAVDGTTLYALGAKETVYSTTDLVHWATVTKAPPSARCITASDGKLYVGTSGSAIYVSDE